MGCEMVSENNPRRGRHRAALNPHEQAVFDTFFPQVPAGAEEEAINEMPSLPKLMEWSQDEPIFTDLLVGQPERIPLLDFLKQDKVWQDKQGKVIEIDSMSLDYKMNALAYMLKRCQGWLSAEVHQVEWNYMHHDGGDAANDSLEHIADFYLELQIEGKHREWLMSKPLARKLSRSIRKELKKLMAEGSQI